MAKKNFIRHLEFYGYVDQNAYNGITNIDLSELYEENREQDKEISEISGETSSKADLILVEELSGKVNTFIGVQSGINESFLESISGINGNIESLMERDVEITDKINEMTDTINELSEIVTSGSPALAELKEMVEAVSGSVDTLGEGLNDVSGNVATLGEEIDKKLDSEVAEATYAKKDDVYSKEEADETFLKEHQDISFLVDDINTLSGMVDYIQEEISEIPAFDEGKFVKKIDYEAFQQEYSAYTASTDEEISQLSSATQSINGDIEALSAKVESVNAALDEKTDNSAFNEFVNEVDNKIIEIEAKKADVSALTNAISSINQLSGAIDTEVSERASEDERLQGEIDSANAHIDDVEDYAEALSGNVSSLEERLQQEIQDRKAGDIALIGTTADTQNDDTIWGAKKYAITQKSAAVNQANEYTNTVFGSVETEITNALDSLNTEINKKADKAYVDATIDDKVDEAYEDLDAKIAAEKFRAESVEINLQSQINEIVASGSSAEEFDKVYRRLNVITTYTGDTPEGYTDSGNGVLDVLHREFHELEEEIGVVVNPTLQRKNEYESAFGTYNISHTGEEPSEQTAFSIGIGTSEDNRKNALEIMKDGTIYAWVEGEYMSVNDLLSMLAHETYN